MESQEKVDLIGSAKVNVLIEPGEVKFSISTKATEDYHVSDYLDQK